MYLCWASAERALKGQSAAVTQPMSLVALSQLCVDWGLEAVRQLLQVSAHERCPGRHSSASGIQSVALWAKLRPPPCLPQMLHEAENYEKTRIAEASAVPVAVLAESESDCGWVR